jgi:hypothetical protein
MKHLVKKGEDGLWEVVSPHGVTVSAWSSNARAWREADRLDNQHLSSRESISDWVSGKVN